MKFIVEIALSVSLGIIFLMSAIPKLRRPNGFLFAVLEYRILPPFLSKFYGRLLPPLELFLALLLFTGTNVRLAASVLSLLICSFLIAVSINIARGRDLDCNCFGTKLRRRIGWSLLIEDGILLISTIVLVILVPTWMGLEPWSLFGFFEFFNLPYSNNLFALLICVGLTLCATVMLRRAIFNRNWLLSRPLEKRRHKVSLLQKGRPR